MPRRGRERRNTEGRFESMEMRREQCQRRQGGTFLQEGQMPERMRKRRARSFSWIYHQGESSCSEMAKVETRI